MQTTNEIPIIEILLKLIIIAAAFLPKYNATTSTIAIIEILLKLSIIAAVFLPQIMKNSPIIQ